MEIVLIPGLWLDGSSWDEVVPALEHAGHRTHALTLPGMESKGADRSELTDAQFTRPEELGRAILASVGPA
jgi:hypothetical protein